MDKSKIPTVTVKLSNGFELELYSFLTQEEETEQLAILSGDQPLSLDGDSSKISVTAPQLALVGKHKFQSLSKNLTWEEFNVLSPKVRAEIQEKLNEVTDLSKKN